MRICDIKVIGMKNVIDSSNIVIVGNWNKYILSPDWIAKNVFMAEKIQVEFSMNYDLPPRYTHENIRIVTDNDKVIFYALDHSDDALSKIEIMIKKLLGILVHTPVRAFGINFSYLEETHVADLSDLFLIGDNTKISDNKAVISNYTINRALDYKDSNFSFSMGYNLKDINFSFNFHYNVTKTEDIVSQIGGLSLKNKKISIDFIKNIYDIELEPDDE